MNQYCSTCGPGKLYESTEFMCPVHLTSLEMYVPPPDLAAAPVGSGAADTDDVQLSAGALPAEVSPSVETAVPGSPWSTLQCWNCNEQSVNPDNSECLQCRKRLVPPRLVLQFKCGTVEIDPGESAEIGREGQYGRLFRSYPNVSRRHAVVGVGPDGRAWIEPHRTPNGTFRGEDGQELDPAVRYPLQSGDQLRFARDATATVGLYALPDS